MAQATGIYRKYGCFGIFLCLLAFPHPAFSLTDPAPSPAPADEETVLFQEVPSVYGASKYEQKVTEAPSSVSIVTAAEIEKYGYRTLAEILQSVRGFLVTNDRNYAYAGVRGFGRPGDYNSRILLLINGHRTNDSIYDGALIGTEFFLDVDLIDRVEVIRGPSSSLYGTNAFFGVVNVITKRGRDLKGPEASASAARYGTWKGRATYGNRFSNGLEMIMSGSYFDSKGQDLFYKEFDDPSTNNGVAVNADDDRSRSVFAMASLRDLTVQAAYGTREKGIPTASFETIFNDNRTRNVDTFAFVDVKYSHALDERSELTARLYYDRNYYAGDFIYDYPPVILNKEHTWGYWWGGELKLVTTALERHKATLGLEFRDNYRQDMENYDEDPYVSYTDDRRSSKVWAVYFQDEFSIRDDLILNAGVRYDHYDTFGGTTNPRVALIYNPFKKTVIKLLYGESFRAPNNFEAFFVYGDLQKANPGLLPEKIRQYELVCEQSLGDHLRMTGTGYYYRIRNLITQQTDLDNAIVYNNVETIHARGVELELEGKWAGGFEGRFSYTFQNSTIAGSGAVLSNSPKHVAKLNVIAPLLPKKLFAGLDTRYVARRKTPAGIGTAGYSVVNAMLFARRILDGLDGSLGVYNLFDGKYGDPVSEEHLQETIEQDGRSYRLKLTYTFGTR